MSVTWELRINGGGYIPAAAAGLSQLRRSLRSHAPSLLTATMVANVDAAPLWGDGDTVELFRNNSGGRTRLFYGRGMEPRSEGSGEGEVIVLEARDPFEALDRTPFFQERYHKDGGDTATTTYTPRANLFSTIDGELKTVAATISEILTMAIGAGVPLQVGTISAPNQPPITEVLDLSCGEAIRAALRWQPDAVTWFDYSTTPPTLHIQPYSALPTVSLSLLAADSVQIAPDVRYKPSCVALFYETTNDEYTTIVRDIYPPDRTGREFGALAQTINLQGGHSTAQQLKQEVITYELTNAGAGPQQSGWWQARVDWLRRAVAGADGGTDEHTYVVNLSFGTVKFYWDDDGAWTEFSPAAEGSHYPNELIAGAITPWMQDEIGIHAAKVKVETTVSYDIRYYKPGAGDVLVSEVRAQPIAVQLVGTDAMTKTYRITSGTGTLPEPVPTGLAEALYSALNRTHWRGQHTFTTAEIGSVPLGVGYKLNVSNGSAAWATMAALITTLDEDIDRGTTHVTFGPPPHLSAGEFVELFRTSRFRRIANVRGRATGEAGSGSTIWTPTWTVLRSGSTDAGHSKKQLWHDPDNPDNNVVTVDPKNGVIQLKYTEA